ncbi:hypothetical protein QR98_0022510 [Sarcoptes scabiei]|uniref:Uncharacterized protein n=1 Tax=Sarcoptes scabiei TaxID=52283 RepID=A0A131ZYD2_SARSC|nr:hypothetical protein QR98_0022510 [Sarcoptes scabiei]
MKTIEMNLVKCLLHNLIIHSAIISYHITIITILSIIKMTSATVVNLATMEIIHKITANYYPHRHQIVKMAASEAKKLAHSHRSRYRLRRHLENTFQAKMDKKMFLVDLHNRHILITNNSYIRMVLAMAVVKINRYVGYPQAFTFHFF